MPTIKFSQAPGHIQTVRASPQFYSKEPWYDFVAVDSGNGVVFCQLAALFVWGGRDLALVCWLKRHPATKECPISRAGGVRLTWDSVPRRNGSDGKFFEVIEIQSIIRRVYITPALECPGQSAVLRKGILRKELIYWLSPFKWDRMMPDHRSMVQALKEDYASEYELSSGSGSSIETDSSESESSSDSDSESSSGSGSESSSDSESRSDSASLSVSDDSA